MSISVAPPLTPSPPPQPLASQAAPVLPARLEFLFRHALKQGEINPLLYLLLRFRREGGVEGAS